MNVKKDMKISSIPSNQELIKQFPFLLADETKSEWVHGNCVTNCWFDEVPEGWRELVYNMLIEIKPILNKKYISRFEIHQIKEKYSRLRFYYGLYPKEHKKRRFRKKYLNKLDYIRCQINHIIWKYEGISNKFCINCGKPSTHFTKGYVVPLCDDCDKI